MTKMASIPENYNKIRAGIVELLKTARSSAARNVNIILIAVLNTDQDIAVWTVKHTGFRAAYIHAVTTGAGTNLFERIGDIVEFIEPRGHEEFTISYGLFRK